MSVSSKQRTTDPTKTSKQGKVIKSEGLEDSNEDAYAKVLREGIVPDVIDSVADNVSGLAVQYGSGLVVKVGDEMKPNDTKTKPTVNWNADSGKYYTLSMTDPDAPSREDPKFGEWQHWLVVNIPENRLHEGQTLTEYFGPKPPKGTGLHRYVFLLFEQPQGKIQFQEQYKSGTEMGSRKQFNTKAFTKKYQLGKIHAIKFFKAKYDGSY